jgi:hypothetical protein
VTFSLEATGPLLEPLLSIAFGDSAAGIRETNRPTIEKTVRSKKL